ncbi:MAG: tRNA (guanosine(46)-N7)-methyltransferase TrmB [Flavobacteriales bacterium]|nr:tRNA (guanosine(46)-N7)-methyltransferase TrmB [Flavobacteriales bacterium]
MAKNKLRRFAENELLNNVIQPTREELFDGFELKGKWHSFFKNNNPIVLELGCGKGEYSIGLAKRFPEKNFIGIDIKGARFWVGAKQAKGENLSNVAFVRSQIELIDYIFAQNEVSEIWITFPDPQIKFRRTKHRLTHPEFLKKYHKVLNPDGILHLKTDSEFLHGYTHGVLNAENHTVIQSNHNIYHRDEVNLEPYVKEIQTHYENLFKNEGKHITYIKFKLNYKDE